MHPTCCVKFDEAVPADSCARLFLEELATALSLFSVNKSQLINSQENTSSWKYLTKTPPSSTEDITFLFSVFPATKFSRLSICDIRKKQKVVIS